MSNPLVTVAIPSFNNEKFLEESLYSITNQTYDNIEYILIDNNSTDNTVKIAKEFEKKVENFKVYINEKNIGAYENWNKCIELASGEYIAIYHSDDVYEKTIVEESVKILDGSSEVGAVSSLGVVIDDQNKFLREHLLPETLLLLNRTTYSFDELFLAMILNIFEDGFICTPAVMTRRDIYKKIGRFDPIYKSACDYEMWLRIAKYYQLAIISKKLFKYRKHDNTLTNREINMKLGLPDICIVFDKYFENMNNDESFVRAYRWFYSEVRLRTAFKLNQYDKFEQSGMMLKRVNFKDLILDFKIFFVIVFLSNILRIRLNYSLIQKLKKITHFFKKVNKIPFKNGR